MAKAELHAAFEEYHELLKLARKLETEGQFERAIASAMEAWNYVEDMIRYARRWENQEFESLQCVDLVMRLAPPLLHSAALERLASILKDRRSIDRNTGDDLAGRVEEARERMRAHYRVLDLVEQEPGFLQSELDNRLGGKQPEWRAIAELLEVCGALVRVPEKGTYRLFPSFGFHRSAIAKCVSCGLSSHGRFEKLLSAPTCPGCGTADSLVISNFERSN